MANRPGWISRLTKCASLFRRLIVRTLISAKIKSHLPRKSLAKVAISCPNEQRQAASFLLRQRSIFAMCSKAASKIFRGSLNLPRSECLPPTFLLPLRHTLTTLSSSTSTADPAPPPGSYKPISSRETTETNIYPETGFSSLKEDLRPRHPQLSKHFLLPPPTKPLESSLSLLPALASQPPHFITAHIHARPYLLTEGDSLQLPFHMPNASPGTVLRLNRASVIGSRDFTFRGGPWVDEKFFMCRALVTGVEQEPERVKIKKKQRNRRKKRVVSQHSYTTLRITELKVLPNGNAEDTNVKG